MTRKSPKPHLSCILETIEVIENYTPQSLETFLRDRNAQDATLMRLQDIGEQLTRIRGQFEQFYTEHHHDSWNKMIGLRNIISHGYREIEFKIIWDVVATRLGEFKQHIQHTLNSI